MQKNIALLMMLALVSATMAGCTGTETDSSGSSSSGSGGSSNQTGNQTSNETSGNGTSAPAVLTPMTSDQVLAFMASEEDSNVAEPAKHGMRMTISGTIDMGMGEPMEDTTIIVTEMEDSTSQRVMNGMVMSMMGGMMSIDTTTIQGASTETGEGVVNIIISEMDDDGSPTGETKRYYAFDHDWDYESAVNIVLEEQSDCPFDEDMDGNPCSATECDWDLDIDEQSQACKTS